MARAGPAKKPKKKMTLAEQSEQFKETARNLGADERPEVFDELVKKIVPGKKLKPTSS